MCKNVLWEGCFEVNAPQATAEWNTQTKIRLEMYLVDDADAVQDAMLVTVTRHCEQHEVFPHFIEDASSIRI